MNRVQSERISRMIEKMADMTKDEIIERVIEIMEYTEAMEAELQARTENTK